jgi:hypothetical protein
MPKTLVGTPDPPEPEADKGAAFLQDMATKTDVELVAAYLKLASNGMAFIHPTHVLRVLKLAAVGLPNS